MSSLARYRAWSFAHPDFQPADQPAGLEIAAGGGIRMVSEDLSVRQAILLLLTTIPGERIMRPDYGCSLDKLAFMPNDATTHGLAIHFVRQALERWERRIEILKLDAGSNPDDPTRIDIVLDYRVRRTLGRDRLLFGYPLVAG
ncbi:hypothetical protein A1507_07225 [Methylomonas koyamae]|uniref:IraD/Gp25-like domain-containing protein n=1 Tax=Methylomonas koyamae TaxID=702114 RepID=A0A177NN27_9GAMM|nr:GPW/gp25 family protein [Methylomonas koyamae]OAI19345.1 hypothetical protein A1507_07225 [Methylomonas koyamae]